MTLFGRVKCDVDSIIRNAITFKLTFYVSGRSKIHVENIYVPFYVKTGLIDIS